MGWNNLSIPHTNHSSFCESNSPTHIKKTEKHHPLKQSCILSEDYVYFVNSYCVQTDKKDIIAATTNYYIDFVSAVQQGKLLAVQFHPEKSGNVGCKIVKRWLKYVN